MARTAFLIRHVKNLLDTIAQTPATQKEIADKTGLHYLTVGRWLRILKKNPFPRVSEVGEIKVPGTKGPAAKLWSSNVKRVTHEWN